jgi:hypothetical protein
MCPKIALFLIKYDGRDLLGIKYAKIAEHNTINSYSSHPLLLVAYASLIVWIEGVFMVFYVILISHLI